MSDSYIEIKKIPPMKPVKNPPRSAAEDVMKNHERKATTRTMIHQALNELKTRKGVSSYAIKKYLEEKYEVKTDKMKYLIKKTLKAGVEDGSIIQVKGIGASGSFKLANVKEKMTKKVKKPKNKKDKENTEESKEKPKKEKIGKIDKLKEKARLKIAEKKEKVAKGEKTVKKPQKEKADAEVKKKTAKKDGKEVKEKIKANAKKIATPAKKKATMMKRKSIGSIIKKPKMKPKMKAQ